MTRFFWGGTGFWKTSCRDCGAILFRRSVENNLWVCPECQYHFRVGATQRVRQLVDPETFDLKVKNPNGGEVITHRSVGAIMDEIAALDSDCAQVLGRIKALL